MEPTNTLVRIIHPEIPESQQILQTLSTKIFAGSEIEMTTTVTSNLVPLDLPKKNSRKYTVKKTLTQIFQPGENIFFRFAELKGHGLVVLHVIGLARFDRVWLFEKTEIPVQFYFQTKGKFFTPHLNNQPELKAKLEELIKKDKMIPTMDEYVEYIAPFGTIKWFNVFSQIGCIASEKGDVFFHLKDLKSYYRHGCLNPGTKVSFDFYPTVGKTFPNAAKYVILF